MKASSYFSSEKGITLIEILASLVILSIIIVSLLSMFIQSSKTNNVSKRMVDATYLAETYVEEINNMNNGLTTPSLDNLNTRLTSTYTVDNSCSKCYGVSRDGHYILIQLKGVSTELGKVVVKIFKDNTKTKQEAQMELLLSWKR
jgi:type II secretory pathway pseudopilin PulG